MERITVLLGIMTHCPQLINGPLTCLWQSNRMDLDDSMAGFNLLASWPACCLAFVESIRFASSFSSLIPGPGV